MREKFRTALPTGDGARYRRNLLARFIVARIVVRKAEWLHLCCLFWCVHVGPVCATVRDDLVRVRGWVDRIHW